MARPPIKKGSLSTSRDCNAQKTYQVDYWVEKSLSLPPGHALSVPIPREKLQSASTLIGRKLLMLGEKHNFRIRIDYPSSCLQITSLKSEFAPSPEPGQIPFQVPNYHSEAELEPESESPDPLTADELRQLYGAIIRTKKCSPTTSIHDVFTHLIEFHSLSPEEAENQLAIAGLPIDLLANWSPEFEAQERAQTLDPFLKLGINTSEPITIPSTETKWTEEQEQELIKTLNQD